MKSEPLFWLVLAILSLAWAIDAWRDHSNPLWIAVFAVGFILNIHNAFDSRN